MLHSKVHSWLPIFSMVFLRTNVPDQRWTGVKACVGMSSKATTSWAVDVLHATNFDSKQIVETKIYKSSCCNMALSCRVANEKWKPSAGFWCTFISNTLAVCILQHQVREEVVSNSVRPWVSSPCTVHLTCHVWSLSKMYVSCTNIFCESHCCQNTTLGMQRPSTYSHWYWWFKICWFHLFPIWGFSSGRLFAKSPSPKFVIINHGCFDTNHSFLGRDYPGGHCSIYSKWHWLKGARSSCCFGKKIKF